MLPKLQESRYKELKRSTLFFGLDELELYLNNYEGFKCDKKNLHTFVGLDQDNSQDYHLPLFEKIFSVAKISVRGFLYGYQFRTVVDDVSVSLFTILYPQNWPEGKVSLVIYSSFFVLQEKLGISILDFIQEKFDVSLYHSMRRFDIAFDTTIPVNSLKKRFFSQTEFSAAIGKDKKHKFFHQTYYIGQIQTSSNRKYLFRIYDKVLDTFRKDKGFLYSHLRDNPEVRRIELEMRAHEAQRQEYSYVDILRNKNDCIQKIFFNYLNKNWDLDIDVYIPLVPYTYTPFDLRAHFDVNQIIPERYLAQVRGYNQKIIDNCGYEGFCQVISGLKWDKEGKVIKKSYYDMLDVIYHFSKFLKRHGVHRSLIQKYIKKALYN